MIEFKILKESKKSWARLGVLKTPNGEVETPSLVPVATQAAIKTLPSEYLVQTGTQIVISNTFHLHLKPGEKIVKNAGGIHKFMNWKRPIMTDSGGFQVFSLGFGRDLDIGKIKKFFPGKVSDNQSIEKGVQPKKVKITEEGVHFRSPVDGRKLFIGPKESIKIQEALGADIIFSFDECTPPVATYEYAKASLDLTHKWSKTCINVHKSKQSLFGIIQGSRFKDLRIEAASFTNSLGFSGYGIGGDLGDNVKDMMDILKWTVPLLDHNKPRHLLGIGYLRDMAKVVSHGIDLFDCVVPTLYARRNVAFIHGKGDLGWGKLNLRNSQFIKDQKPLDKNCSCFVCQNYKRTYLAHLVRSGEISALSLITYHNLHFFNEFVAGIRKLIRQGKI